MLSQSISKSSKRKEPAKLKLQKPFFKTIIVGGDFSGHSIDVFKNALRFAKKWKTKVVLVHVYDLGPYDEHPVFGKVEIELDEKRLCKELGSFYGAAKEVVKIVKFGDPPEELIKIATSFKDPILFVGHSEKSGLERFILGSVSKDLAYKSPVPVWIQ